MNILVEIPKKPKARFMPEKAKLAGDMGGRHTAVHFRHLALDALDRHQAGVPR
jgi:hypothetical protein